MTSFAFIPYLSKHLSLPPSQISIKPLTGGFVNETIRATFTPPTNLSQFNPNLPNPITSIIVKYAPPYMASDPTRPFLVHRQTVEANALSLLHSTFSSSLLTKHPLIKIPRLISHDIYHSILSMTDLGDIKTLDEWLSNESTTIDDVNRIGKTLGSFLAEFFQLTKNPSPELLSRTSSSNDLLMKEWYEDVIRIMSLVLVREAIPDRDLLINRVQEAIGMIGKIEPVLGMVDLWTGNIGIDPRGNCGLIDWEYFGISDVGHEIGMLGTSPLLSSYPIY